MTPLPDRAAQVYEDWRARFAAGRHCPGLAALRRLGMLAALAAAPRPAASSRASGRRPSPAAMAFAAAALLRRLPDPGAPTPACPQGEQHQ